VQLPQAGGSAVGGGVGGGGCWISCLNKGKFLARVIIKLAADGFIHPTICMS